MRKYSEALFIELDAITDPETLAVVLATKLREVHAEEGFPQWAGTDVDGHDHENSPLTKNPYWDILRLAMRDESPLYSREKPIDWFEHFQLVDRKDLAMKFAWAIPTPMDLQWLTAVLDGRNVVEIGAGSGYWAWQLSQLGTNVIAYDNWEWEWNHRWHHVNFGGPEDAARHPDRALMLIWPPYATSMAAEALKAYTGDMLIYAGEGEYGCTGDDEFHQLLEEKWELKGESSWHVTYSGIHCILSMYRRRA